MWKFEKRKRGGHQAWLPRFYLAFDDGIVNQIVGSFVLAFGLVLLFFIDF